MKRKILLAAFRPGRTVDRKHFFIQGWPNFSLWVAILISGQTSLQPRSPLELTTLAPLLLPSPSPYLRA